MGRPYNSILVAEFLHAKALENRQSLEEASAHKLLFILTGWFLVNHNCRILHERAKVWLYGPVFTTLAQYLDWGVEQQIDDPKFDTLKKDTDLMTAIDYIMKNYAHATVQQLVIWSMKSNGPWAKTVRRPGFQWYDTISEADIKTYFTNVTI